MNKRLTHADALIVQYLLEDPTIRGILVDESKKEVYKRIDIEEDGSIILGKTCFRWWNNLVNDYKVVSFNEFAIKAANAISGQKNNTNERVFAGLLEVIGKQGIKNEDYSYVIDQLLIATKFGMDGPLKCRCIDIDSGDPVGVNNKQNNDYSNEPEVRYTVHEQRPGDPRQINVHVHGQSEQIPMNFKLNPFGETINVKARLVLEEEGYKESNE